MHCADNSSINLCNKCGKSLKILKKTCFYMSIWCKLQGDSKCRILASAEIQTVKFK